MSSKHTPEPWAITKVSDEDWLTLEAVAASYDMRAHRCPMSGLSSESGGFLGAIAESDDAARIIACVNACAGINPEAVPKLLECCIWTLDAMLGPTEEFGLRCNGLIRDLRAAIALATPKD